MGDLAAAARELATLRRECDEALASAKLARSRLIEVERLALQLGEKTKYLERETDRLTRALVAANERIVEQNQLLADLGMRQPEEERAATRGATRRVVSGAYRELGQEGMAVGGRRSPRRGGSQ